MEKQVLTNINSKLKLDLKRETSKNVEMQNEIDRIMD